MIIPTSLIPPCATSQATLAGGAFPSIHLTRGVEVRTVSSQIQVLSHSLIQAQQ